jgi:hypothetical protein
VHLSDGALELLDRDGPVSPTAASAAAAAPVIASWCAKAHPNAIGVGFKLVDLLHLLCSESHCKKCRCCCFAQL